MMDIGISSLGLLRDIRPDELELMLAWRNAPNVRANMYTRHEISLEEHLAWWANIEKKTDQRYFMYELDGSPAGVVAFAGIDHLSSNSSWAFYASPQAPKGVGSRMEFLALEQAFGGMCLHKLHCEVLAFNTPVIKLHQKFGFKIEGILRDQHLMGCTFVDVYQLGMLASEWAAQREQMLGRLLKFPAPEVRP